MKEVDEKTNILGQMRSLKIGQEISFPVEKLYYIRAQVSSINLIRGYRSLRSKSDVGERVIKVIRTA